MSVGRRLQLVCVVAFALVTCVALIGAASATGDSCDQSLAQCNYGQSTEPVPLEGRWLGTIVPPRPGQHGLSLALYRSLIPTPFSMPKRPLVGIYLVDLYAPHSYEANQPWNDYAHWLEGGVDIAVSYHGEQGWYHLAMPVNSDFEYGLGRAVGFPKYHATATFRQSGAGWFAQATPTTTERPSETVAWSPGKRPVSAALSAYATQQEPFFSLNPALAGPSALRVKFTPKPYAPAGDVTGQPGGAPPATELAAPTPGLVRFKLDPNIDRWDNTLPKLFGARRAKLSDLVNLTETVPGVMWHSQALYLLQNETVGRGGYSKQAAEKYLRAKRTDRRRRAHHHRRHRQRAERGGTTRTRSLTST